MIAFGFKSSSDNSSFDFENEMKKYLSVDQIEYKGSPFLWWKTHQREFPVIASIAREFLCAPATSIPSERVFSKTGSIINKKRTSLSSKNVNMLTFLSHNQKLINN